MSDATELVRETVAELAGMPTPLEIQLDSQKAIQRISAIAQVIEGCAKTSLQRTNPQDWVRQQAGGKESFYLQATGAQKLRPIFGIYYRDRSVTKEVFPDGNYAYLVMGTVGSKVLDQLYGEITIEIDGGRSSNDSFFKGKDGTRTPDPLDVRKAALANWETRAVTALLGLKNLTRDDLVKNGIDVTKIQGVEFRQGSEGGGNTSTISEAQAKRLYAIASQGNVAQESVKELVLAYGFTSSTLISRDKYEEIVSTVQAGNAAIAKKILELKQAGAK